MEVHPEYGISLPERGWVPSPSYLLRRERVLRLVDPLVPGEVVEIGCGPGALSFDLAARGHRITAMESSERALALAREVFRDRRDVSIVERAEEGWSERFDLLLALEVLEHIEDDELALREWASWVRPGGRVILSVPAHRHRWNATDEWAGHFRRYEPDELEARLGDAGLEPLHLECYGFPLRNALEALRARTFQRRMRGERAARTAQSGVARSVETRLYPLQRTRAGVLAMKLFQAAQRPFLDTRLGNGLLVLAEKPISGPSRPAPRR